MQSRPALGLSLSCEWVDHTPDAHLHRLRCTLQVEAHPYFTNETLLQWCRMKGIALTAYSPLGSPDSAAELKREFTPNLLGDPVVVRIAEAHGREPGQVG